MNWVRLNRPSVLGRISLVRPESRNARRFLQLQLQLQLLLQEPIILSSASNNSHSTMDDPSLLNQPDQADRIHEVVEAEEPQAELCAVGKQCVSIQALHSVAALTYWLQERLPSGSSQQVTDWGRLPGTKRVANLWLELAQGEISLEDSKPPKRTVHVASIKIIDGSGRMLLEAYQEMADGTIRERNRPLSEKLKPGESVENACLRGIREELGSDYGSAACVQMMQHSYKREVQERESFSYPGLMTCYVLHHMMAVMKHLPSDDFITEENELCANAYDEHSLPLCMGEGTHVGILQRDESAIGVKRHFWKWVPDETPGSIK